MLAPIMIPLITGVMKLRLVKKSFSPSVLSDSTVVKEILYLQDVLTVNLVPVLVLVMMVSALIVVQASFVEVHPLLLVTSVLVAMSAPKLQQLKLMTAESMIIKHLQVLSLKLVIL